MRRSRCVFPSVQSAAAVPVSCDDLLRGVSSVSLLEPFLPVSLPCQPRLLSPPPPLASPLADLSLSSCVCWPSMALLRSSPVHRCSPFSPAFIIRSSRLPSGTLLLRVHLLPRCFLFSASSPLGPGLLCPSLTVHLCLCLLVQALRFPSSHLVSLLTLCSCSLVICSSLVILGLCPPSHFRVCDALVRPPCALSSAHLPLVSILCSWVSPTHLSIFQPSLSVHRHRPALARHSLCAVRRPAAFSDLQLFPRSGLFFPSSSLSLLPAPAMAAPGPGASLLVKSLAKAMRGDVSEEERVAILSSVI